MNTFYNVGGGEKYGLPGGARFGPVSFSQSNAVPLRTY